MYWLNRKGDGGKNCESEFHPPSLKLDLHADHGAVAGSAAGEACGFGIDAEFRVAGQAPFGAGDGRLVGWRGLFADALTIRTGANDDFIAFALMTAREKFERRDRLRQRSFGGEGEPGGNHTRSIA